MTMTWPLKCTTMQLFNSNFSVLTFQDQSKYLPRLTEFGKLNIIFYKNCEVLCSIKERNSFAGEKKIYQEDQQLIFFYSPIKNNKLV